MGIYDGLQYFRKKKTKLHIGPLAIEARVMDISNSHEDGDFRIEINEKLSDEERIKALIHEILHFGNPYMNLLPMRNLPYGEYPRIEREIEELTEQVYSCQPILTRWLRKKITTLKN